LCRTSFCRTEFFHAPEDQVHELFIQTALRCRIVSSRLTSLLAPRLGRDEERDMSHGAPLVRFFRLPPTLRLLSRARWSSPPTLQYRPPAIRSVRAASPPTLQHRAGGSTHSSACRSALAASPHTLFSTAGRPFPSGSVPAASPPTLQPAVPRPPHRLPAIPPTLHPGPGISLGFRFASADWHGVS
jgi:hypothetical protein